MTGGKLRASLAVALLLSVGFLLLSFAWASRPQGAASPASGMPETVAELPGEGEAEGVTQGVAASMPYLTPEQLAGGVPLGRIFIDHLILLGVVETVGQAFWNTPDRKEPADFEDRFRRIKSGEPVPPSPPTHSILTPVTFKVERYFKHPQPGDRLTVLYSGGQVGRAKTGVAGVEAPKVGQRFVLFLYQYSGIDPNLPIYKAWRPSGYEYLITPDNWAVRGAERMPASELYARIENAVRDLGPTQ